MSKLVRLEQELAGVYKKLRVANEKIEELLQEKAVQATVISNLKREVATLKLVSD